MENSSSTFDSASESISTHVREVLFGDEPLAKIGAYAQGLPEDSPWAWFTIAAQRQDDDDAEGAIAALHRVLQISGLEVRVYLQAWHCLRNLWQLPPERLAGEIQGVIVEVALERGLDIVAAYADGSAQYINYSGVAIVWDTHDADIDRMVTELLAVGQSFVDVSEPWDGLRPPAPDVGTVRINALTFGGLHLGQGSFKLVSQDGLGGLALRGAFDLMQALVAKVKAKRTARGE